MTRPLRVLHVVASTQRRGAETFALDLVHGLGDFPIDQHVAALRRHEPGIDDFGAPLTVLGKGSITSRPRLDLRALMSLRRLSKRWSPDIVQAHGGEAMKHCAVSGRLAPIVYRRIGMTPVQSRQGVRRFLYRGLLRRVTFTVAVADAVRRDAIEFLGLHPETTITVPNAASSLRLQTHRNRKDVRRELGIPLSAPVLLSVGELSKEKAPLEALSVASNALHRVEEARYVVVGDGVMRGFLEAQIDDGIADRIVVVGARDDVPDIMAASDLLMSASRTEGMPGVLIEAGILGLPVAALNVGGISEVIVDGKTGLLVSPTNHEVLEDEIVRLLLDDGARLELGRAASLHCLTHFEIGVVAKHYLKLYRRLAGRLS